MESKDVSKILEKSYQLSDFSNEPRTEFEYKNFRCEYVQHGTQRKWWCGYIEIPRKFFQNKDENSIIESLNWFGGTTYKEEEGKNIKIGFHTNHLDGELFTKFQVIQDIQKTDEQILIRRNGDKIRTSVQKHNDFLKTRTKKSPNSFEFGL